MCIQFGLDVNMSCSSSISLQRCDGAELTSRREMVMSTALIAIPPNPRRCRVLRPAFSTRKSCGTDTGGGCDLPLNAQKHTQRQLDKQRWRRSRKQR